LFVFKEVEENGVQGILPSVRVLEKPLPAFPSCGAIGRLGGFGCGATRRRISLARHCVPQLCKDDTIDLTFSASKFKGRKQMLALIWAGWLHEK
jgi:hypothetical protein